MKSECRNKKIIARIVVLCAIAGLFAPGLAAAGLPTDQVRSTVDRVLLILQDPKLKPADKVQERREQLSKTIAARFDFAEMAKRALGSEWRRITPTQQQQFVELFTDVLRDSYISTIDGYKGEKVTYLRDSQEPPYAAVQTALKANNGVEYSIEYKLHMLDNEWKVYDVIIENISIVINLRSQFARVINQSGFDGLVRAMQEKRFAKSK